MTACQELISYGTGTFALRSNNPCKNRTKQHQQKYVDIFFYHGRSEILCKSVKVRPHLTRLYRHLNTKQAARTTHALRKIMNQVMLMSHSGLMVSQRPY